MAAMRAGWLLTALGFTALGVLLGQYFGEDLAAAPFKVKRAAVNTVVATADLDARAAPDPHRGCDLAGLDQGPEPLCELHSVSYLVSIHWDLQSRGRKL